MSRPGQRQRDFDEMTFPIRGKAAIAPGGLGRALDDLRRWLREELGPDEHAVHNGHGLGTDALGLYVHRPADLARCLEAFPLLELADGNRSWAYSSPASSRSGARD